MFVDELAVGTAHGDHHLRRIGYRPPCTALEARRPLRDREREETALAGRRHALERRSARPRAAAYRAPRTATWSRERRRHDPLHVLGDRTERRRERARPAACLEHRAGGRLAQKLADRHPLRGEEAVESGHDRRHERRDLALVLARDARGVVVERGDRARHRPAGTRTWPRRDWPRLALPASPKPSEPAHFFVMPARSLARDLVRPAGTFRQVAAALSRRLGISPLLLGTLHERRAALVERRPCARDEARPDLVDGGDTSGDQLPRRRPVVAVAAPAEDRQARHARGVDPALPSELGRARQLETIARLRGARVREPETMRNVDRTRQGRHTEVGTARGGVTETEPRRIEQIVGRDLATRFRHRGLELVGDRIRRAAACRSASGTYPMPCRDISCFPPCLDAAEDGVAAGRERA